MSKVERRCPIDPSPSRLGVTIFSSRLLPRVKELSLHLELEGQDFSFVKARTI